MKVLEGGISNIAGFSSLGKNIGIKTKAYDFAVLYSDKRCKAVAVYTQNAIKGAPLYVTMDHLQDHMAQAIVVSSGNANVTTGQQGLDNAYKTTELVAAELGIGQQDVLVASTGVIGVQLPFEKIESGTKGIKQELAQESNFAEAIMTTDTFKKEICVEGDGFKIAGAAKGSGMIEPNMATMLAFLVTDADINTEQLQTALKTSVDQSFNMTSVDTDTSTSDNVVLLSNQQVKNIDITKFQEALDHVCLELTKMIARDGEGATKLIVCDVVGAKTAADAKKIAKSVISSPLVKTAIYGNDPNWGRIMMALGKSGAEAINPASISILINQMPTVENGEVNESYKAEVLSEILRSAQEILITIDMGVGSASATAYGCDMSEQYIKINADYTT